MSGSTEFRAGKLCPICGNAFLQRVESLPVEAGEILSCEDCNFAVGTENGVRVFSQSWLTPRDPGPPKLPRGVEFALPASVAVFFIILGLWFLFSVIGIKW